MENSIRDGSADPRFRSKTALKYRMQKETIRKQPLEAEGALSYSLDHMTDLSSKQVLKTSVQLDTIQAQLTSVYLQQHQDRQSF